MADNYLEKRFEEHYHPQQKSRPAAKPLKIRRVVVTGGANGIGAAIVRSLRLAGNNVAFFDIDDEKGCELSRTTGTTYLHVDVRDASAMTDAFDQIVEKWGDVDILINNVGVFKQVEIVEEDALETFDNVMSINVRPVFVLARLMAKLRKSNPSKYGRIINLCSTRYRQSEPDTEGYSASKGAIDSLTHSLALSLSKYHITVNCISPGWIETGDYLALSEADHHQHPSSRVGKPEDIARMVRFLCEEENDFINGENIVIDGGMTRKMIYV